MAYVVKSRKILTGPITFSIGVGGDYPTLTSMWLDILADWDLAGNNVTAMLMDDQTHAGLTIYGLLPGQIGPHGLTIRSSALGRSSIRPSGAHAALEMAYGAQCRIERLELDGATQAYAGTPQDVIMLGQGSRIVFGPEVRIRQDSSYNFISMAEQCSLDVYGNIYVMGQGQCFLTIDMGSAAHWVNNGIPNQLAMFMEPGGEHGKPYWQHSFLNPRGGSVITHQAVDYHGVAGVNVPGNADGYRYKVDKGGILDVDIGTYPNGLDRLPGSVNTAWPVQGFIF